MTGEGTHARAGGDLAALSDHDAGAEQAVSEDARLVVERAAVEERRKRPRHRLVGGQCGKGGGAPGSASLSKVLVLRALCSQDCTNVWCQGGQELLSSDSTPPSPSSPASPPGVGALRVGGHRGWIASLRVHITDAERPRAGSGGTPSSF